MKTCRMPIRLLAPFGALGLLLVPMQVAATTLFGLVDTGELFVSFDQGINWTIRSTLPVRDAVALGAGASTSELYLASRSGVLYRSTDAGMNWSAVGVVNANDAVDMLVAPDLALLLLTATGSLYKSTDQGASFTGIAALTGSDFVSLTFTTPAVRYYVLSRSGGVYESADGGTNWTPKGTITLSSAVELRAVGSALYAMSAEGDVYRSSDAGVNWTPVGTLSQSGMTSLTRDGTTLIASTGAGEVATSGDGAGWTWQGVINQITVMALGTDALATTGVERGLVSGRVFLTAPWPNPARTREGFSFTLGIPSAGRVGFELLDVAGRRVASRSPETLPAGQTTVRWTPQVPAAGLYLIRLRLESGRTAETRVVVIP